ncbi:MAG: glycosyltransferase family 2 protein [Rugosibacter sp.]|nr:glycosyltransferase family 2 protein [Rugosibacter sp.]
MTTAINTAPQISAIVVNYNAGALLRSCIDSLLACPLNVEVIVVDNASQDGSLGAVQSLPNVRLISNAQNLGFAAACNQGIAVAKADNLLFLNPDCTFELGTLVELLTHLHADAPTGMVGGLLVNPDGTEQGGGRRAIPTPWRSFVRAFGLSRLAHRWPKLFFDFHLHKQPLPSGPIAVEAISGACMLVKRAVVDQVGVWDEAYFLHCEDLDWCMRMRLAGWNILFVPSAKITHALGVCSKSRPFFVEWHKHCGMVRFYRKFFRHQYPGVVMWLVILGVWFRFGLVVCYHAAKRVLARLKG